jgi:predicted TIM-barrel fold metal-dependent hydrolase
VYQKDGEKYFIVDGHSHFWDASPANWVPGQEQFAKGWIECFHAYQGLGPAETHWPIEKFMKYSEDDLMTDVFENGHVDKAIFQPTYLTEWYGEGFNTTERNATLTAKYPDRFITNTRWDPREGDDGLKTLAQNVERYGSTGVKLYTAEWRQGSRGWKLTDPEAYRYLRACEDLGIRNIHVHKGPTIWPLDKDAFDVTDVDHAATDFPRLNFVVEHVGLPRIEDFCFMATQEPNVYAGLSVVIGGLMHARPRFFAKVMGELLFWVGEDKMLFGSDYGIWEPKWQVEGFVDWDYPAGDEFSDYPRVNAASKKKILGLNAAKLYNIEVPAEYRLAPDEGTPAARDDAVGVSADSPMATSA